MALLTNSISLIMWPLIGGNLFAGVYNVCRTSIIKDAWERRKKEGSFIYPHVHGWVYGLHDGLVRGASHLSRFPLFARSPPVLPPLTRTSLSTGSTDLNVTIRGPEEVPLLVQKPVNPANCV